MSTTRDETSAMPTPPSQPRSLLQVTDLTVSATGRQPRTIVERLSFSLAADESLAIVGESGSGKSLTARALVNLLPTGVTATGSVRLGDSAGGELEVLTRSRRAMQAVWGSRISMVTQDPFTSLNPSMRIWAQVTEAVAVSGQRMRRSERRRLAARLLAEVAITDESVLDRYPFELSGGMRQRVAIAAAIAAGPNVLIADEPTSALDTTTQHEVINLMQRVRDDRGMGLIMITHDLRLAFSVCDRVLILYAGQALEVAPSDLVWREPLHPYSLGLLLSEPPADKTVAKLAAIPGTVPAPGRTPPGCIFAPRCVWAAPDCTAARPPLVAVTPGPSSLSSASSGTKTVAPRLARMSACIRIADIEPAMRALRAEREQPTSPRTTSTGVEPLLEITGLTKTFPHAPRPALRDADLVLGPGESVALVGESGSGKTTLARCVLGLETPTSGRVVIAGTDVSDYRRLDAATLRSIRGVAQIVFQDPYSSLNPMRTIGFTLGQALSMRTTGAAPMTIDGLLEMVGLPATHAAKRPAWLSGGERQRVAIARALAVAPRLLVCDEVVSALDVSVQAQILNLLADLRRDLGLSLLFVSHDLAVVRQVTDRAYVLYQGRVVESGPTASILDDPQDAYTRRLIAAVPKPELKSKGAS